MRDVAIIGVGILPWGELWEESARSMWVKAALGAMDDAGVDQVDSIYVGCMTGGLFFGQEHLASVLPDELGLNPVPAARVESACASGGLAMKMGWLEVASGLSDLVLVSGVEKMTDVDGADATYALATASDQEYEAFHGNTFPGLYAMIARSHMEKYGTTREQLAQVAVKNHANGMKNPNAQYKLPLTVEGVISSVMVADPLRILDCSPITDGAAAAILCPLDQAAKISQAQPVRVAGMGHATNSVALHTRKDLTVLEAVKDSGERAYAMAGVGPGDIDIAEVHDCFTIAELCAIEALGFVETGHGGPATENGFTALDGQKPINTSGGLKSKGHPVGATGIGQIHELVTQIRGDAGDRQVKGAKRGLAQNMGGSGGSSIVHILEAV
jgi:acetyl-CoA C-acetyltransferase